MLYRRFYKKSDKLLEVVPTVGSKARPLAQILFRGHRDFELFTSDPEIADAFSTVTKPVGPDPTEFVEDLKKRGRDGMVLRLCRQPCGGRRARLFYSEGSIEPVVTKGETEWELAGILAFDLKCEDFVLTDKDEKLWFECDPQIPDASELRRYNADIAGPLTIWLTSGYFGIITSVHGEAPVRYGKPCSTPLEAFLVAKDLLDDEKYRDTDFVNDAKPTWHERMKGCLDRFRLTSLRLGRLFNQPA